ncbi:unnamed protein product [Calypogeia fissa]
MSFGVAPIRLRTSAGKSWGSSCKAKSTTAACNHGAIAVNLALGSNFCGAALTASSPKKYGRADRSFQSFCIGGRRAENGGNFSADDESWIADFRSRIEVGEHAEHPKPSGATIGTPLSPDTTEWRDFRARLHSSEMGMTCPGVESKVSISGTPLSSGTKHWAHLISTPEVGCVLVATSKLRRHAFLKEAVVLFLGYADNHYYGIILNKIMPFPAYTVQGVNQKVLLGLAGCPKYVGGHFISGPKIHVLSRNHGGSRGFSTLLPGLYLGGDAAVPGLMNGVADGKIASQDLKLYVGQMEWECSLLFAEVFAFGWWDVVACSSSLFDTAATGDLWQRLRSLYVTDPGTVTSFD